MDGQWAMKPLSTMPWGGKLAITAFLCAVGVGYLFALAQLKNKHGDLAYETVVRDYYGTPAVRDSIDAHWSAVKAELIRRWEAGERGERRPAQSSAELSLDDLDAFDRPARSPTLHDRMLAQATSLDGLKETVDRMHQSSLAAELGLPTVASLVSLGHTHTFGHIGFLMPISVLLLMTSLPWRWKGLLAAVPMVGVTLDYPAALLTRTVAPQFAFVMMAGGALMAVGFLVGFLVGIYDLWMKRA